MIGTACWRLLRPAIGVSRRLARPASTSAMPTISASTSSSASRICRTVAVSVMSSMMAQDGPFATVAAQGDELLDHRQHRVAEYRSVWAFELAEVVFPGIAVPADFIAGVLWNDPETGLSTGKRQDLRCGNFLDAIFVGENTPHQRSKDHGNSGTITRQRSWMRLSKTGGPRDQKAGAAVHGFSRACGRAARRRGEGPPRGPSPSRARRKPGGSLHAQQARAVDGGAGRSDTCKASR